MAQSSRPPVNTNWSIDTTTKSVITLSTGVLTAALSDNVQPLAVLACEAYGATLPMCPEVCMKMEKLAKRKHVSHVMRRVGVVIGFAPGDVADQLASNEAGVRFLALAAALLSLGSPFKAALCLHKLLDETSPQKQLLPTIQQLKDLFVVLERKIGCSGFFDTLEVWDMILRSEDVGLESLFIPSKPAGSVLQIDNAQHEANDSGQMRRPQEISNAERTDSEEDRELSHRSNSVSLHSLQEHVPAGEITTQAANTTVDVRNELNNQDFTEATSSQTVMEIFSLPQLGLPDLFSGLWKTVKTSDSLRRVEEPQENKGERHENRGGSGCPPIPDIANILRAISDMERVGEASFTIIRTPPTSAVWIIAFVRWCLGIEPYVRSVKGQSLVLKQPKSKVLVEIGDFGSKEFHVQTFKTLSRIGQLLWESRSVTLQVTGWGGMANIKTYFNTRSRNLRSLYRLYHINDSLLLLAWKITDRIHSRPLASWAAKPFPSSDTIVALVAKYFDIDDPFQRLKTLDRSELESIWSRLGQSQASRVAELFLEILISSLIENVHSDTDPTVHVEVAGFKSNHAVPVKLIEPLALFLLGKLLVSEPLYLSLREAEYALLCLLGSEHVNVDGGLGLATSGKGQVEYLSVLETLTLSGRCIFQRRVFPGWIQYDGQRYAYITGDHMNQLADTRDTSKVSAEDFSLNPFTVSENPKDESCWMFSVEDNYLSMYWVPYLDANFSLDIRSVLAAADRFIFLDQCGPNCPPLSDYSPDLIYCRTVASTLSDQKPQIFRVLSCHQNAVDVFFAQAAIGEILQLADSKMYGKDDEKILAVTCGRGCISCACRLATAVLDEVWSGRDISKSKVVIIN